jgi:membrane protein YqaA with SNARE-associated domain
VIGDAGLVGLTVGVGLVSALVPVVNAELYLLAIVATAASPAAGVGAVVGLAVGQVAGKVCLFLAARRGRAAGERWRGRHAPSPPRLEPAAWRRRLSHWALRGLGLLDRGLPAAGVLFTSAAVGMPPLAVTTVAAGARRTPASLFVVCALSGRLVRFGILAAPLVLAL